MINPYILHETDNFAVVYKPPRMHSAPLRPVPPCLNNETLFDWYAAIFPPVAEFHGRKNGGGGLLHRLDYDTHGLVLFAKNQKTFECILMQQEEGKFIKDYSAICQKAVLPPAFPPPYTLPENFPNQDNFIIQSYFRPFGPGRKQVRPVADKSAVYRELAKDRHKFYRTEIINTAIHSESGLLSVTARLIRGFRHQVRCHLAWIGYPVLNDPLYGTQTGNECGNGFLCLRACRLSFLDPESGQALEYQIESIARP